MIDVRKILKQYFFKKLSFQLSMSVMVVLLIVNIIGYIRVYNGVSAILLKKASENMVSQFEQFDYNISRFFFDIDMISMNLVMDSTFLNVNDYLQLSTSEKIIFSNSVLQKLNNVLINYEYIDSILYYGDNSLVIKKSDDASLMFFDENREDSFYNSDLAQIIKNAKQKLIFLGDYSYMDIISTTNENSEDQQFCIVAGRHVIHNDLKGILIFNINNKYFSSIYNKSFNIKYEHIYIISNSGQTISDQNEVNLGIYNYDVIKNININTEDKITKYISGSNSSRTQVVCYELSAFDGFLVGEISINELEKDITSLRTIQLIAFIISFVVGYAILKFLLWRIMSPLKKLTKMCEDIKSGNIGLMLDNIPNNEFGILITRFNEMSNSISELFEQKLRNEEEKRNLEMEALRMQINPHFVYNTLNVIKYMAIMIQADNIVGSVTALSDFLEPVFRNRDILCTVQDEIKYIKNYVQIVNYRITGEYKLELQIPEKYMTYKIVRFILQPLVENAIKHGYASQQSGIINVSMFTEDSTAYICITDYGKGIEKKRLTEVISAIEKRGQNHSQCVGLFNVNRRIQLNFGEEYGLSLRNKDGGGTEAILKLPVKL